MAGTWFTKANQAVTIASQGPSGLWLGGTSRGVWLDSTHIEALDWHNETGTISASPCGETINWSDGTSWSRADVTGEWYINGSQACSIQQTATGLAITNEAGNTTNGRMINATQIEAFAGPGWSYVIGTLTPSPYGVIIRWSNGTWWDQEANKFYLTPDNTLWINGAAVYNHVKDFAFTANGALYLQCTDGTLVYVNPPGGNLSDLADWTTLPNVEGTWFGSTPGCSIVVQGPNALWLGGTSRGMWIDSTHIEALDWSVKGKPEVGTISTSASGQVIINWSDGTSWTRGDFTGKWYINGSQACSIQQTPTGLAITNEAGNTTSGRMINATQIEAFAGSGWSDVVGTLTPSPYGLIIHWSNGTWWDREANQFYLTSDKTLWINGAAVYGNVKDFAFAANGALYLQCTDGTLVYQNPSGGNLSDFSHWTTLPDVEGTWFGSTPGCSIVVQGPNALWLGGTSRGMWIDSTHIEALDWYVNGTNEIGTISTSPSAVMTINWSDGTSWSRGDFMGQWFIDGSRACSVQATASGFLITNETGNTTNGRMISPTQIEAFAGPGWSDVIGTLTPSPYGLIIHWSNDTWWDRKPNEFYSTPDNTLWVNGEPVYHNVKDFAFAPSGALYLLCTDGTLVYQNPSAGDLNDFSDWRNAGTNVSSITQNQNGDLIANLHDRGIQVPANAPSNYVGWTYHGHLGFTYPTAEVLNGTTVLSTGNVATKYWDFDLPIPSARTSNAAIQAGEAIVSQYLAQVRAIGTFAFGLIGLSDQPGYAAYQAPPPPPPPSHDTYYGIWKLYYV